MWKRLAAMLVLSVAVVAAGRFNSVSAQTAVAETTSDAALSVSAEDAADAADAAAEEPAAEEEAATDTVSGFTVTYLDGDETLATEQVEAGEQPTEVPQTDSEGQPIVAWITEEDGETADPEEEAVTQNISYAALAAPPLTTDTHVAYASGQNGYFRPNGALTRAEAAVMLYRLLSDTAPGPLECSYTDVEPDDWYYDAVYTLASLCLLAEYGGEEFLPDEPVLRGEFVTLLALFFTQETGENPFPDVDTEYWACAQIVSAAAQGWISGYDDGAFYPDETITRAETVAAINEALGRGTTSEETQAQIEAAACSPFVDVSPSDPYYLDVLEATTAHTYTLSDGEETWTGFQYTDCVYEPGMVELDGYYYHVNENLQFDCYDPGIAVIDGKLYYVNAAGNLPVLSTGVQALGGTLYCVLEDGSLASDYGYGVLYFGADGAYTSGNADLDALVDEALAQCVTDDMTQAEKLYVSYIYLRDNYTYLNKTHCTRGTTDWAEEYAVWMFEKGKGNCYCYAAAFCYMARRLGYQAEVVSGGIANNLDHGWTMIDGLLYDVEMEYAYRYRYANYREYDLFGIEASSAPFLYYFP